MGPFGPQDKRFQLPGNVGFDCHLGGTGEEEQRTAPTQRMVPDVLTAPSSSERHDGITVVTVKQKRNPTEAELNSQQLLDNFINGAKEICFLLWRGGYWADFIDPSSGRAYFGPLSHDQVLEADQGRHSGFHIEDVASCRLTVHILRDTHTFAGTLITNAPSGSLIMRRLRGHAPDRDATHAPSRRDGR
ncbi:hypothetical protein HF521_014351 [Silurus meridionalis]|uniref:Uncharacterized protein n=1 Tax=Silurus meridionalis TaxID=175797 RepID=A0A8T0AB42_SILME|nr:hypothetical protein HF521_014351 [Silurus meridionalis]